MQKNSKQEISSNKKIKIPSNWPETPKLEKFDVNAKEMRMPDDFFMILEGSRRSGKSIFAKWFLYHYKEKFDLVLVMTETAMNGFWQPLVSNQYVHNGWQPYLVNKLLEEQATQRLKSFEQKSFKPRHVLLILDDIVGDRNHIHEDETLNRLAVQGRHFFISIFLTTQEPHAIGTSLRNNADAAVIFQQKSKRAKESVINDFLGFKMNYKWQAEALLNTYTNQHDCIFLMMYNLDRADDKKMTDGNKEILVPAYASGYYYVPQSMTFDEEKQDVTVPPYVMGCEEQKRLAKTKKGSIPLILSS